MVAVGLELPVGLEALLQSAHAIIVLRQKCRGRTVFSSEPMATQAIRLDPNRAAIYKNRGQAYELLRDYDRAISDVDHAIRLDPKLAAAYNNRGFAYFVQPFCGPCALGSEKCDVLNSLRCSQGRDHAASG
jgi:tetratricopeptide (TPR) repeat protein